MRAAIGCLAMLAACATAMPDTDLADIVAAPSAYDGQTVRTCGWVSYPHMAGRHPAPPRLITEEGQGIMLWTKRPLTQGSQREWKCMAVRIETMCLDAADPDCVVIFSRWRAVEQ
ncbi:MAG: hypothetical protein WDM79_13045 [Terricaulis sp.]